jgi:phage-related protein (TIGR01555 family)
MTKPTGRPRGRPPKARQDAETITNADGWTNTALNIGRTKGDPIHATKYAAVPVLDRGSLERVYRGDGLARRVVDLPVDDATREWIEADPLVITEMERLGAKREITNALKWARLYGGAVIVALLDDSLDFDQPVKPNGIRRVLQLRVYDRHRVTWTTADIDKDPESRGHGKPTHYTVQPIHGAPYRVHASRLHILDGLELPEEARQRNNGWGDSALQSVYQSLMNYGVTMGASASIVRDFVQTVIGVKGLADLIRQGGDDIITKRATLIDMTRSVANTIFFDADGETYSKQASSVTGLPDLWDRFALHVSASTGIPATRLMGKSAAGLNATGEGDERQWHDVVRAYQQDQVRPAIQWLADLIEAQLDWSDTPETMAWTFPALGQPSEAVWADIKLKTAQADAIYLDRAGVDPEYLFELRFGQGEYRPDVTFDRTAYLEWLTERARESGVGAEGDAPEGLPLGEDKAKEALNGAQIKSLQEIAFAVAAKQLPKETGLEIITTAFAAVGPEQAARILDPTDGFSPDDLAGGGGLSE